MAKNTHLTLDERISIQSLVSAGAKFTAIGAELGKDPSTIPKEIRNHYKVEEKASFNPCMHRKGKDCKHHSDLCRACRQRWSTDCRKCDYEKCHTICPDFKELICLKLKKPPYVCNRCNERHSCKLRRHLYDAKYAHAEYEFVRSESRQGFAITSEELTRIDEIISPLIKQGQSVHQICVNNGDVIMLDEKTIYNYIDAGLLSVGNIDLPRKVRYR
ncbi:helix-turn-helix domain-containing protein, partial [Dehalobacter sp.]|uniref:helix-turn-helix domain-containing protein n=1 Tax=Dehalobacter sp. TaxID=1962289 RepID=UPI00258D32F5